VVRRQAPRPGGAEAAAGAMPAAGGAPAGAPAGGSVRLVPRLVVAGTASGVGKTTIATGLMAALAARGLDVAAFKVGPDFIDPSYHAAATGRPPRNLDAFLSGTDLIAPLLAHGAAGADVAVIEGVMGLFDGAVSPRRAPMTVTGGDGSPDQLLAGPGPGPGELASTAQVAKLLDAPVVLVVDARGLGRSIAAMVGGYAAFDPAVRIAGVIANRVGSARHVELLEESLAPLGLPLLGAVPRDDGLVTPSRHLGLIPFAERPAAARRTVTELAGRLAATVNLEALLAVARSAPPRWSAPWSPSINGRGVASGADGSDSDALTVTGDTADGAAGIPADGTAGSTGPIPVAVAGGPAFTFVYTENLELLAAAGAEPVPFDPTADERLPAGTAALYLGGGFPELYGEELTANERLRAEVGAFAASGRPVVAECGGLLYLCRSLDGRPMCGVLDAEAALQGRLTLGYREAAAATTSPAWPAGTAVRGHEFHHSTVTPPSGEPHASAILARQAGSTGPKDGSHRRATPTVAWLVGPERTPEGFVTRGVHASYLHTHWAATPRVAARLVAAAAGRDRTGHWTR
jgi:cobyrinic acid a,c-diamide synthase